MIFNNKFFIYGIPIIATIIALQFSLTSNRESALDTFEPLSEPNNATKSELQTLENKLTQLEFTLVNLQSGLMGIQQSINTLPPHEKMEHHENTHINPQINKQDIKNNIVAKSKLEQSHHLDNVTQITQNDSTQPEPTQFDLISEQVNIEEYDDAWSASALSQIEDSYNIPQQGLENVNLLSADCKSSFCQLDFTFNGETDPLHDIDAIVDNAPWNGEIYFKLSADTDPPEATILLSREVSEFETFN